MTNHPSLFEKTTQMQKLGKDCLKNWRDENKSNKSETNKNERKKCGPQK